MENIKIKFEELFFKKDRYSLVLYVKEVLENKKITVIELYENILYDALKKVGNNIEKSDMDIWEEHLYSNMARNIIEISYPYVYESRMESLDRKSIVFCPTEEYHELGARIVSDFLTILGYETLFIGANTPTETILKVVEKERPNLLGISISNYYNLIEVKNLIKEIKKINKDIKILIGGGAVMNNKDVINSDYIDYYGNTFNELMELRR